MIKTFIATAFISLFAFNSAQAAPVCKDFTGYQQASASLIAVSCTSPNYSVLAKLSANKRFPGVEFLGYDGSCYVSDETQTINVLWGSKPITIKTVSAWTKDFNTFDLPYIFGGTGTVGTVATQMTVFNNYGKYIGQIYTSDTINLVKNGAPEVDVVTSGSGYFDGARGSIKITSSPGSNGIVIESIEGTLCVNQ